MAAMAFHSSVHRRDAQYIDFGSSAYDHYTLRLKKQVQRHRALRSGHGLEPSEGRRSIWRSAIDCRLKTLEKGNRNKERFLIDMWSLLGDLTDCSAGIRHVDHGTCSIFKQMVNLRETKLAAQPLDLAERLAALWHDIIFDFDLRVSSQADIATMDRWLGVEAMYSEEHTTIYDPIEGEFLKV
ncbi:hypothetical protein N7512_000805 [Penicillium capsulatum]|nr:hypothetical protein N7512_000805 [Penicillium capsulatum]